MKRCRILLLTALLLLWPLEAMAAAAPADGHYTIEVNLSGGTGRASIASPTTLTVKNGSITAIIRWSSPHYEYMLVNGTRHTPIQTEGNATFEIPVTLDDDIPVRALTIAMSQPHEIEYVLRFDSATLKPAGGGASAGTVIWIAAAAAAIAAAVGVAAKVGRKAHSRAGKGDAP